MQNLIGLKILFNSFIVYKIFIYSFKCFILELINSFEDRSYLNIISSIQSANNYLNKLNNIKFGPIVEPRAILQYLF